MPWVTAWPNPWPSSGVCGDQVKTSTPPRGARKLDKTLWDLSESDCDWLQEKLADFSRRLGPYTEGRVGVIKALSSRSMRCWWTVSIADSIEKLAARW